MKYNKNNYGKQIPNQSLYFAICLWVLNHYYYKLQKKIDSVFLTIVCNASSSRPA